MARSNCNPMICNTPSSLSAILNLTTNELLYVLEPVMPQAF